MAARSANCNKCARNALLLLRVLTETKVYPLMKDMASVLLQHTDSFKKLQETEDNVLEKLQFVTDTNGVMVRCGCSLALPTLACASE